MDSANEKVVCKSQPEQLDLIRRWCDALEGIKKVVAFDLMNQVLDRKIANEGALALLDKRVALVEGRLQRSVPAPASLLSCRPDPTGLRYPVA